MAKHAWVQNPFLMLPSTSSVSTVCLLLLAVTQAAGQEVEGSIKDHKITYNGACPPKPIVSWTAVAPPRQESSLEYNVFCCGGKNSRYCRKPQRYEQKLKALQCCQKSTNQFGIKLSCDVAAALRNIYNPDAMPPQTFLYTVIAVTDGANVSRYSQASRINLGPRNIICSEPSNFTAAVSSDSVRLSWGMPPRMACRNFHFKVRYSLVPDGCSDDSIEKDFVMALQTYYAFSSKTNFQEIAHVYSKLKPSREYIFSLTCNVLEEFESSAAVMKVKMLPRAPREGPRNLKLGNPVYFMKKRNITLTWKAPEASCPANWDGRPLRFRLQYFPIHKSNHSAASNWTALNHENDVSKISNVTTVDINPSSSSTVIGYLSRDEEYALKLAMCNEAGCSPGTGTVLVAEPVPTVPVLEMKKAPSGKGGMVWVIVAASVTGAVVALIAIVAYVKR